jgi:hypothetical protein
MAVFSVAFAETDSSSIILRNNTNQWDVDVFMGDLVENRGFYSFSMLNVLKYGRHVE